MKKNQDSGHLEERAGTEDRQTTVLPFWGTVRSQEQSLWLAHSATADNSKVEVSWPVSRINYLLLCYLVAKKHTKKHILKQHTLEKSAMGRNTGFKLHACNWLALWFSRWGFPGLAASRSPGNLIKMQIPRPHPRPTKFWTLGVGPSNRYFPRSCRWFWYLFHRRTTGLAESAEKGSGPAEPSLSPFMFDFVSLPLFS